ncbi:hypothetical protein D3C72_1812910 [compost metagenome]
MALQEQRPFAHQARARGQGTHVAHGVKLRRVRVHGAIGLADGVVAVTHQRLFHQQPAVGHRQRQPEVGRLAQARRLRGLDAVAGALQPARGALQRIGHLGVAGVAGQFGAQRHADGPGRRRLQRRGRPPRVAHIALRHRGKGQPQVAHVARQRPLHRRELDHHRPLTRT